MHASLLDNPGLTVALALFFGTLAESASRHLKLPSILLLLLTGLAVGPDGLNLVRPGTLHEGLEVIVSFAVAIILFEGGLSLKFKRLARSAREIRQLVTLGAAVNFVGGALLARFAMGWTLQLSGLFGALMMVTGPTVVQPLLRRLRIQRKVATILEAEGILIDAVGAITAAVMLEVALREMASPDAAVNALFRLGIGALVGAVGGLALVLLLRQRRWIPDGMENLTVLAWVVLLAQLANLVLPESGLAAVTAAGLVVGNLAGPVVETDVHPFKSQLTTLFIGMLFILLAATVRLESVVALGLPGLGVALGLMVVVRPLAVWVGSLGTALDWKQKLLVGWIGPRGIVAAAVASLVAARLESAGQSQGLELQSLVFLVIVVTAVTTSLTGGWVARLLGLRLPPRTGWMILGAHALGRAYARFLQKQGEDVVFVDSNSENVDAAETEGFTVRFGRVLDANFLRRAGIDRIKHVMAVGSNEETNFLFVRQAQKVGRIDRAVLALGTTGEGITEEMVKKAQMRLLPVRTDFIGTWSVRLQREAAPTMEYVFEPPPLEAGTEAEDEADSEAASEAEAEQTLQPPTDSAQELDHFLILGVREPPKVGVPYVEGFEPSAGATAVALVDGKHRSEAERELAEDGWVVQTSAAAHTP